MDAVPPMVGGVAERQDEDERDEGSPSPGLRRWQLLVMWVIVLGSPAAVFSGGLHLVTAELSDTVPEGECSGIGFGCTLSERDGVELLAQVYGTPAVAVITAMFAMVAGTVTAQSRWSEVRWLLLIAVVAIGVLSITDRF